MPNQPKIEKLFPRLGGVIDPKADIEIFLAIQRIYDYINDLNEKIAETRTISAKQTRELAVQTSQLLNSFATKLIKNGNQGNNPLATLGEGTITEVDTGTGLTGGPITETGVISLADTAVVPGSYTNTDLTVNQQGQITAATNGSGSSGSSQVSFSAENKDAVTIEEGQIVASHSSGVGVVLANASDNSKNGVGLMTAQTIVGNSNDVQTDGVFELADWTNVIGAVSLAAKTVYYLDTTSGKLTAIPPAIAGEVVQRIGVSVSTTKLWIEIEEAILL